MWIDLELVTDLEQVKKNLIQYNKELQNGEMTLRTNGVQQWYYVHELGLFGPSRYIGYIDINIQKHNKARELDGGKTTQAMSKWFVKCTVPVLFDGITQKLLEYLYELDMDVRRDSKHKLPSFKLNLLKSEINTLNNIYHSN